jgi:crotonobetainyl-CoA:carnitine CoA-transferase CaiB-like acyl-CoA transferase
VANPRPGPLSGIRVFDLTLWMVGPWAGMRLGSLGADVIHIERPGTPPEQLGHVPPTVNGTSVGYLAWNMNKRGLGLDLKNPEHIAQALDVAATCDIFLVNMRPEVVARLGLGYDVVAERNPGIVYCDVTGWGHDGPMAQEPGSDGVIQGYTGFWSLNGTDGEYYRHYTQMDASTGELTVVAALAALRHRRQTGQGQRIRVSMLKAAMYLQGMPLGLSLAGEQLRPRGAASQFTAPDDIYTCVDQLQLGISVTTEEQWTRFCDVLGTPELAAEPRYATNAARLANSAALSQQLHAVIGARTRPYWLWRLRGRGVPYGYPLTFEDLRAHDQVRRLGLLPTVPTDTWGPLTTGGSPWVFSHFETAWTAPPLAGEHSAQILGELPERTSSVPGARPKGAGE